MRKINFILLSVLVIFMMSCNDDDNDTTGTPVTPPAGNNLTAAGILLSSIEADGGTAYDADSPALTFTADQNVFLPSVLGIDFRNDRNVVPAGPTARFPMFQGWETLPSGEMREGYYVITEASDRAIATELGVIFAPRMANAIGSGGEQTSQWSPDGRLVFQGSVDFSLKRNLVAAVFQKMD